MIILGIDPGTALTGYGLVKVNKKKSLTCLDYGVIETTPQFSDAERLRQLENGLNKIFREYQPDLLAVEKLFFFRNQKTVITVSQAKGVILLVAAKKRIPIYQFSPPQVKTLITNNGKADKNDIQDKVKNLLGLKEIPQPDDAADALALAICCSQQFRS
jgi:crossover junction endodeoxyribonuclease RuvC